MKHRFYILIFLMIWLLSACDKPVIPKPENLIHEKQMIEMLVDIHLAEATFSTFRYDSIMKNNSSVNFYYSVLDKYNVADSVFEKSYVYYASVPKNFEKMYRKVMSTLSEKELELSGRKNEELQFDDEPPPKRTR